MVGSGVGADFGKGRVENDFGDSKESNNSFVAGFVGGVGLSGIIGNSLVDYLVGNFTKGGIKFFVFDIFKFFFDESMIDVEKIIGGDKNGIFGSTGPDIATTDFFVGLSPIVIARNIGIWIIVPKFVGVERDKEIVGI